MDGNFTRDIANPKRVGPEGVVMTGGNLNNLYWSTGTNRVANITNTFSFKYGDYVKSIVTKFGFKFKNLEALHGFQASVSFVDDAGNKIVFLVIPSRVDVFISYKNSAVGSVRGKSIEAPNQGYGAIKVGVDHMFGYYEWEFHDPFDADEYKNSKPTATDVDWFTKEFISMYTKVKEKQAKKVPTELVQMITTVKSTKLIDIDDLFIKWYEAGKIRL